MSHAPARSCGTCTLCCKVFEVPPIDNKPRGVWCKHCKPGKGCGIWETRPEFCRDFHCLWIKDAGLGPEWKPDVAKFVMNYREDLSVLNVMVDVGMPEAWRKEPYYRGLQNIAANLAKKKHIVQITVGHRLVILTPEREFDMGVCDDDLEHVWKYIKVGKFEEFILSEIHRKARV
jgi:hypothetical protein